MTEPGRREQQAAEALRVAAESVGYALLTVDDLFSAASAALAGADGAEGGADEATLAGWRARLAAADGLVALAAGDPGGPDGEAEPGGGDD